MGKGGGGFDTSAMQAATDKSLKLQKQMYEEGKQYALPYYQAGTAGLDELMMRLGLGGSAMGRTESQIRSSLAPQYTTKAGGGWSGDGAPSAFDLIPGLAGNNYGNTLGVKTFDGNTAATLNKMASQLYGLQQSGGFEGLTRDPRTGEWTGADPETLRQLRAIGTSDKNKLRPYENQMIAALMGGSYGGRSSVDSAGLDAAVQAELAKQGIAADNPLYGSLLKQFGPDTYQQDPGYQFRLAEGNKAIQRAMAAAGKTFSPEQAKALAQYGSDLASQEYGQAYARDVTDKEGIFNKLAAMAGIGQTATGQQLGLGQSYASNVTDLYTGMGNAITSAQVAKASQPSMFDSLLGAGVGLLGAGKDSILGGMLGFSDIAMKENIKFVGIRSGFKHYEFNYKGDDKRYIGVMAQDIEQTHPHAVKEINGYKAVNYGALGLKMEVADAH